MRPRPVDDAGSEPERRASVEATDLAALLADAQQRASEGDAPGARAVLEKVRPRVPRLEDRTHQAAALQAIAALDTKLGNHVSALQSYERAQSLWHNLGDRHREATAWLAVGDARRALTRLPRALEAYREAANIFAGLDDALGQAHASFKLAQLATAQSPDAAQKEFARAAELYSEADRRAAGGGLRIANPHLPDHVDDLDAVEPWIMAKVAEREIARLGEAPQAAKPKQTEPGAKPATAPPRHRELKLAGMVLAGVTIVFIGLTMVSRYLPMLSVQADKITFLLIAPLAGAIAWYLLRHADIESKALKHGVPAAVAVLVYAGGLLVVAQHAAAERQDRLWTALVDPPSSADAAAAAANADATRKLYAQTLAMYEQQGNQHGQADILRTSAEHEVSLDQVDRALELYARSYFLYRNLGVFNAAADVSGRMGDVLRANNRLAPARERYAEAAGLYEKVDNPAARIRALRRLGDVEGALGHFDTARDTYLLALAHAQSLGDTHARSVLLLRIGRAEGRAGRPDKAREAFARARTLAQERRDAGNEARAWLALAQLEISIGNGSAARDAFQKAVDLADAANDPALEAKVWRWRGDAERAAQQFAPARQDYSLALRTAEQHKLSREQARALLRLAAIDVQERNADAALARYRQAHALYQQLAKPVGRGHSALGMGDAQLLLAQREAAQEAYRQALNQYEQAGYARGQIAALERLSRLNADSDAQAAQKYASRAAELRKNP